MGSLTPPHRPYVFYKSNEHHRNWDPLYSPEFWTDVERRAAAFARKAAADLDRKRAARLEADRAAKAAKHQAVRLMGVRSAKAVA